MIRVHVICEGQTEEMFVKEILCDPLRTKGIYLIPSCIGKPGHKGGDFKYERLLNDLKVRLLKDRSAYCTTLFDFYGLPSNFPGKREASLLGETSEKAARLTERLMECLRGDLGDDALRRFIPYIQMHEFEGLLFSDPVALAKALYSDDYAEHFSSIRQQYSSPECINNSRETAPSKRIAQHYRQYDKIIHGSLAAIEIGIDKIREECLLFNKWITEIEACGQHCLQA